MTSSKTCLDCGETKPLEDFPRSGTKRGGYCKPCHNARGRASRERLYGSTRHYHLLQRYGIGAGEVAALIEAQGGLCPSAANVPRNTSTTII